MLAGTILSGKYRLDSLLGQGGMGAVWRGEHLSLKAPVAIKLMDPALAQSADGLARFHREAHAAALIRSPHVVQVLDHGLDEDTNTPFIVMELLDGETLGKRLNRQKRLSLSATAGIVADVCRALVRAHQAGVVHRDLKPENIFLVNDEREFAKVLDFGVAKANAYAIGVGEGTRTGALIGTPYYMSPEQIRGAKDVDHRSDLWSLAVIACECVTGRRPFEEATVGGLAIAICTEPVPPARSLGPCSPEFEAWLERALDRNPERRFQSARELADALLAVSEAERSSAAAQPVAAAVASSPQESVRAAATQLDGGVAAAGAAPSVAAARPGSHPGSSAASTGGARERQALSTASPLSNTFGEPRSAAAVERKSPALVIGVLSAAALLATAGVWYVQNRPSAELNDETEWTASGAAPHQPASERAAAPSPQTSVPAVPDTPRLEPRTQPESTAGGEAARAGTPASPDGATTERPRVRVVNETPRTDQAEPATASPELTAPAAPKARTAARPAPPPRTPPKPAVEAAPVRKEPPPPPAPAPPKPARTPNLLDALSGER